MKYFIFFLLLFNTCVAQKITVKNQEGENLANVSVFLVGTTNSLIGITNGSGISEISVVPSSSYLFHLLGYEDLRVAGSRLGQNAIILKSATHQLEEIVIGYSKFNIFKVKNIPGNRTWSYPNFSQASLNKVIQIKIDSAGFLNKLTFPIKIQDKSNVSDYRFVLFKDENGKPGEALANENIIGKIDKRTLQFNLKESNLYIEEGSYFFGFEALTPASFIKKEGELKKGKLVTIPLLITNSSDTSKTYIRYNLGEWQIEQYYKFDNGKRTIHPLKDRALAYELEILTPIAK